jgi:hypothetical protein
MKTTSIIMTLVSPTRCTAPMTIKWVSSESASEQRNNNSPIDTGVGGTLSLLLLLGPLTAKEPDAPAAVDRWVRQALPLDKGSLRLDIGTITLVGETNNTTRLVIKALDRVASKRVDTNGRERGA